MYKMKHVKIRNIVAALLLTLSSCGDYLTIDELDNTTVAKGYYHSSQRVEQAVIGIYVDVRKALMANYAWLMYGEARAGDLFVEADFQDAVASQRLTANNVHVIRLTDWEYFYDAIKDANDLLAIIDNIDGGILTTYEYNLFKGEALALKSMAYFYLGRIWGNIPSAETDDFGKPMDGTAAIARAAAWAREAKDLLPWMLINDDGIESEALTAVRFNKTAATLLLAQEELWLGNAPVAYQLLSATVGDDTADSLSGFGLSLGEDRRMELPDEPLGGNAVHISLDRLDAIYPEGDARRTRMFNISAEGNVASLVFEASDRLNLLDVSEIPLLLAEAAWRSGNLSEAKAHLTTAAAGATEDYSELDADTFGDALLLERQRILMGQGQRLFDLMRFGKVSNHLPAFTEDDVQKGAAYWPLSQRSIRTNAWTQNDFWSAVN